MCVFVCVMLSWHHSRNWFSPSSIDSGGKERKGEERGGAHTPSSVLDKHTDISESCSWRIIRPLSEPDITGQDPLLHVMMTPNCNLCNKQERVLETGRKEEKWLWLVKKKMTVLSKAPISLPTSPSIYLSSICTVWLTKERLNLQGGIWGNPLTIQRETLWHLWIYQSRNLWIYHSRNLWICLAPVAFVLQGGSGPGLCKAPWDHFIVLALYK